MKDYCSVVEDWDCKATPQESGGPYARCTCYACGNTVCSKCSRIMTWKPFGRRRICANCEKDEKRFAEMARERSKAG